MAAYKVGAESIEEYRQLAECLLIFRDEWEGRESYLASQALSLADDLGRYGDEIMEQISDLQRVSWNAGEDLDRLRSDICALADKLEEFLADVQRDSGLWTSPQSWKTWMAGHRGGAVKGKRPLEEPQDLSGGKPRTLLHTGQELHTRPTGGIEFDHPKETGRKLDLQQGKASVDGVSFLGTCGLVSCVNLLRLAGVKGMTEETLVNYAANHRIQYDDGSSSRDPLCVNKGEAFTLDNGATDYVQREKILRHFGLESESRKLDAEGIAQAIEEGKGVIVSVDVARLYGGLEQGKHAVVPISTVRDAQGNLLGFEVVDSNNAARGNDTTEYYTLSTFSAAISKNPCNVTKKAIW